MGAIFQRLCGNKQGIYYDDRRIHSVIIVAFYRLLQRRPELRIRFIDEEQTGYMLTGHYDKIYRYMVGRKVITLLQMYMIWI